MPMHRVAFMSSALPAGARLVGQIIEPSFNLLSVTLSELMTSVVAKLYRAFTPEAPDTPKIVRLRGRSLAHLPLQLPACAVRLNCRAELRAESLQCSRDQGERCFSSGELELCIPVILDLQFNVKCRMK